jgi:hypothetical protein
MKWKYWFILLLVIGFSKKAITQGNVFQNNTVIVGTVRSSLPTYKENGEYEGNPFFSKDWVKGSVKTTDNQEFSNKLLFMYDKFTGYLYLKKQDSDTTMVDDKSKIYSFSLVTDKPHIFIRSELFSADYPGKFFEVLVLDDKRYSLLKYTEAVYEKPRTAKAAEKTVTIAPGRFTDNVTYFISFNKVLQPVELKKKSFVKSLDPNDAAKAEAYIKNNYGDFDESYIINMLDDINEDGQ